MSFNKVILEGNCGADPKITRFDNNSMVASFSIATTEKGFTTKSGKAIPDRTFWHNIVVQGGLVKVVEGYVKKGSSLLIEGRLHYRDYEKDGRKITVAEVKCDNLVLLSSKPQSNSQSNTPPASYSDIPPSEPEDDLPF